MNKTIVHRIISVMIVLVCTPIGFYYESVFLVWASGITFGMLINE